MAKSSKPKGLEANIGKVVKVTSPNLWVAKTRRGDKAFLAHAGDAFRILDVVNIRINSFYEIEINGKSYYITANQRHVEVL